MIYIASPNFGKRLSFYVIGSLFQLLKTLFDLRFFSFSQLLYQKKEIASLLDRNILCIESKIKSFSENFFQNFQSNVFVEHLQMTVLAFISSSFFRNGLTFQDECVEVKHLSRFLFPLLYLLLYFFCCGLCTYRVVFFI